MLSLCTMRPLPLRTISPHMPRLTTMVTRHLPSLTQTLGLQTLFSTETVMVLIRNDPLDYLPTQFSGKSSCEIPFATMFIFQKIHVMHSHLISRLPSAYEMQYAISIIFIPIYIKYAYILKFTFTPHVIQSGLNNTQISSLEQITISSPMAYTHNYIPYN